MAGLLRAMFYPLLFPIDHADELAEHDGLATDRAGSGGLAGHGELTTFATGRAERAVCNS